MTRTVPGTASSCDASAPGYLTGEGLEQYIEFAKAELGAQVAIHLRQRHWLSSDFGAW